MEIKPSEKGNLCLPHQVVVKLVLDCSHHLTPVDPERHEEPEEKVDDFDQKRLIEKHRTSTDSR